MPSLPKAKAPRYSAAQWEAQKTNVERLYIEQDRPLKEVIQILAQEFSFQASEKQLKSRLPKWGLDVKNLKSDTIIQLARAKAKRKKLENKDSAFRVYKKSVDDQKIDRYLRRHEITNEDLLAMASPVDVPSPSFSVFTPHNIRSPTPEVSIKPASTRSPTPAPSLILHDLSIKDSVPINPTDPNDPSIPNDRSLPNDLNDPSLPDDRSLPNDLKDPTDPNDPSLPDDRSLPNDLKDPNYFNDPTDLNDLSVPDDSSASNDPSVDCIIEEDSIDALSMDLEMDIDEPFWNKEHSTTGFQRPRMETVANWKPESKYKQKSQRLKGSHRSPDIFTAAELYKLFNSMRQGSVSPDDSNESSDCDPLTIEYHQARANPSSIAEQKNPPSTPAEIPGNEIEARARRISTFHGSVLNRYLDKILHRSRLRNRFERGIFLPAGREIWYCVWRNSVLNQ